MTNTYRRHSFWLDSLPDSLQPRGSLPGDRGADVVVVGAGYTGLWTAYFLKKHQPDLDIVVCEAEVAGFGASGRNGGWCSGFLSGIDHWLQDERHREGALRLQRLMFDAVSEIGRLCERENIDCHFEQSGAIEFAVNQAQLRRQSEEVSHQHRLGFTDQDYRRLSGDELRSEINIERALGGYLMSHCAAIHPARLARGLADTVERMGVSIFEQSPVTGYGPGRVHTSCGEIRAEIVLIAAEGYGGQLPGYTSRLIPLHSMMVCTEPLSPEQRAGLGLRKRYTFGSGDHIVTYGQPTADGRIAFGCRGTYHYGARVRDFSGVDHREFDIVRTTLLDFFPSLHDVEFTHAWGGAMAVARSLSPSVNYDAERGLGQAGGYFGNGVAAAQLAGRTLADLVLRRDTDRVHTPWVNSPEALRRWEPEPFRWLGIRFVKSLMEYADRAESKGSGLAPLATGTLGKIWS